MNMIHLKRYLAMGPVIPSVLCFVFIAQAFVVTGCGKSNGSGGGGGANSTTLNQTDLTSISLTTSLLAASQAFNDAETFSDATLSRASFGVASTCPDAFSACSGNVRAMTFAGCTIGSATATGLVTLTYDSLETCTRTLTSMPSSGSVNRTTSGLRLFLTGENDLITSENRQNYRSETIGGGHTISYLGNYSYSANILGSHRIRTNAANREVYNLSFKSTVPLAVSGSLSTRDRYVSSGTMNVNDNINKTTAVVSFTNVRWTDRTCCHPTDGTMTSTVTDESGNRIELNANISSGGACGLIAVAITRNGNTTRGFTTLQSCQ